MGNQCIIDPNKEDLGWTYCPSFGAAVAFSVLFGLATIAHIYQAYHYRKVRLLSSTFDLFFLPPAAILSLYLEILLGDYHVLSLGNSRLRHASCIRKGDIRTLALHPSAAAGHSRPDLAQCLRLHGHGTDDPLPAPRKGSIRHLCKKIDLNIRLTRYLLLRHTRLLVESDVLRQRSTPCQDRHQRLYVTIISSHTPRPPI